MVNGSIYVVRLKGAPSSHEFGYFTTEDEASSYAQLLTEFSAREMERLGGALFGFPEYYIEPIALKGAPEIQKLQENLGLTDLV